MSQQTFSLQPFPSAEILPDVKITGNISRKDNQLAINYQLVGDLKQIIIAQPSNTPARKDELWQDTCFEFFLGIQNSQRYWEFNLSPAGNWNVYHFDGYRQGMQEEKAFTRLPFKIEQQTDSLALALNFNLPQIITVEQILEVSITTVIKHKDGGVSYWALAHRGVEADFHLRDSFIIELSPD
ncbi:DOMON-like domain-containing protein [Anabaena subtropica]|uniref:DOMON-like domain-containing protein n=1 Tax=Anabaena subtropica FACHB-260 TaxID=2692884 RepID=A0ABR8CIM6_9NOST|nr:DOMON-like domain-containing protein [Anabaena subtropica]MBD2342626.1 DOMON-like domain-containing protein [Anabaena subtropica FACHB-260]